MQEPPIQRLPPLRRARRRAPGRHSCPALVLAGLALLVASAQAGDMAAGIEAYQKRDFTAALAELAPLAETGDPRAQTIVGIMHEGGEGVPVDHAAAARWFRLAAEQGYDPAQYSLANLYAAGRGVPRDEREANFWFASAAAQGNRWAARRIGAVDEAPARSLVARPGASTEPVRAAATGIAPERLIGLMGRFPTLAAETGPASAAAAIPAAKMPVAKMPAAKTLVETAPVATAPAGIATAPAGRGIAPTPAVVTTMSAGASKKVASITPSEAASGPPRTAPEPSITEAAARLGQLDHGPMTDGDTPDTAAAQRPVDAPAARAGPAQASAGGGRYRVQIASMRSAKLAERAVARVARTLEGAVSGLEPRVARADLGDARGIWFRGQLGPIGSVAEARRLCALIVERGGTPHCLPVNEPAE